MWNEELHMQLGNTILGDYGLELKNKRAEP
jgi:hypothetical protein